MEAEVAMQDVLQVENPLLFGFEEGGIVSKSTAGAILLLLIPLVLLHLFIMIALFYLEVLLLVT